MSLNLYENDELKEYINPNFNIFNCNNLKINGTDIETFQTYTPITSNLSNIVSAVPTYPFLYQNIDSFALRICGQVVSQHNTTSTLGGQISFDLSLPISVTVGNKGYGICYAHRQASTRTGGLIFQIEVKAGNVITVATQRGINYNGNDLIYTNMDFYIEL